MLTVTKYCNYLLTYRYPKLRYLEVISVKLKSIYKFWMKPHLKNLNKKYNCIWNRLLQKIKSPKLITCNFTNNSSSKKVRRVVNLCPSERKSRRETWDDNQFPNIYTKFHENPSIIGKELGRIWGHWVEGFVRSKSMWMQKQRVRFLPLPGIESRSPIIEPLYRPCSFSSPEFKIWEMNILGCD